MKTNVHEITHSRILHQLNNEKHKRRKHVQGQKVEVQPGLGRQEKGDNMQQLDMDR